MQFEEVALSLRGHLFSSELKLAHPLLYQCFTKTNSSSTSYNWNLWTTHLFLPRKKYQDELLCLHSVMWAWWKWIFSFCSCIWAEEVSWEFASDLLGREVSEMRALCFQSFPVYWYFESSSDLSNSKPHVWDKNTQIWMLNQESCSCFMYVFSFEMFECIYCTGRDRVALCSALYGTCRCRAGSPTELWSSCLLSVKPFWGCPFCDKWEENQEGQQQSS